MSEPVTVTLLEQQNFIARDLAMRRLAYPRMIAEGSLTEERARRELATIEAVHASLFLLTSSRGRAPPRLKKSGGKPLIMYFTTEEDRAAFVDMLNSLQDKPTMEVPDP